MAQNPLENKSLRHVTALNETLLLTSSELSMYFTAIALLNSNFPKNDECMLKKFHTFDSTLVSSTEQVYRSKNIQFIFGESKVYSKTK